MASQQTFKRRKQPSELRQKAEDVREKRMKREARDTTPRLLIKIAAILLFFAIFYFVMYHTRFEVKKFEIEGNSIVSDEDIISLTGISEGSKLFQCDTGSAADQVALHVMIDSVDVRIRPFDTVFIQVTEKNPVAGFYADDGYFYIDENMVVIAEADTEDENMPIIFGFELPGFVSMGLQMEGDLLADDLDIAAACRGHFKDYRVEICAVSESVNDIYVNGVPVHLGSLGRLEEKLNALEKVLSQMSVQKLESLESIDVSIPSDPVITEMALGEKPMTEEEKAIQEEEELRAEEAAAKASGSSNTASRRDTAEQE